MASPYRQPARGIRKSGPIVTIAAAGVAEVLYQQTNLGQNPRTVIIRKIMTYTNVGNCVVDIGIGLAPLVNIIPTIFLLNTFDNEWTEDEIPEVEVSADITVQSDILGCQVQIEVEEIGS